MRLPLGGHGAGAGILLAALLALLHAPASAAPLHLDFDPGSPSLGRSERQQIENLLDELRAVWSRGDSSAFAAHFDATRGVLLGARLRDEADRLRYPPCFAGYAQGPGRGTAGKREALRRALAGALERVLPPAHDHETRLSLVHSDSSRSVLPGLHEGRLPATVPHEGMCDSHPMLREMLMLSFLTELPWRDPLFAPWRASAGETPAARSAPGVSCAVDQGLPHFGLGPWARDEEIAAWADSLLEHGESFADAGFLKRKFLGLMLRKMGERARVLLGAHAEYVRQRAPGEARVHASRRDSLAGRAPDCPLGEQAVLRLVFLPDSAREDRWLLSLLLVSELDATRADRLLLEPGWSAWLETYGAWHLETLERIAAAE